MNKYLNFLKDKYNKYISFISLDELGNSNRIIKFIGLIFIGIGGLIFSDKFIITDLTVTSIALSGIFFIATDFSEYFILKIDSKKAIPGPVRYKKKKKYILSKTIFLFLAVLSLIIGPYINLKSNSIILNRLSDSLSIIAIGLTVLKIGIDNSKKKLDRDSQIADEYIKVLEAVETKNKKDT